MEGPSHPSHVLKRSAQWLVAEALVVALGVFAALIAEGWRQDSSDRAAEERSKQALATEFEENRVDLEHQFEVYERRAAAIEAILDAGKRHSVLPTDSLDGLFRWSIRTGSYDPPNGVLASILASGDLQLIRDPELRHLLARWPSEVGNFGKIEAFYNNLVTQYLRPRLRSTVGLPSGMGENDFLPGSATVGMMAALDDPVLEQVLRELHGYGIVLTQGGPARNLVSLLDRIQVALPGSEY